MTGCSKFESGFECTLRKMSSLSTVARAKARKHGWHQVYTDGQNSIEKRWGRQVVALPPAGLGCGWGGGPVAAGVEVDVPSAAPTIYHLCALFIKAFIIVGVRNMCSFNSVFSADRRVQPHVLSVSIHLVIQIPLTVQRHACRVTGDSKQPTKVSVDGCCVGNVSRMQHCLHPNAAGTDPRRPLRPWMQGKQLEKTNKLMWRDTVSLLRWNVEVMTDGFIQAVFSLEILAQLVSVTIPFSETAWNSGRSRGANNLSCADLFVAHEKSLLGDGDGAPFLFFVNYVFIPAHHNPLTYLKTGL